MFKKIIIVFLLYIIYTLLFTNFTHLRKPNVEILKEQAADVKSGYNKFVDYVKDFLVKKDNMKVALYNWHDFRKAAL